jgi:alpha-galactosidase
MASRSIGSCLQKGIRETVQHGSLYRLISPQDRSQQSVTESVSLDKKPDALFAFLDSSQMGHGSIA